MTNRPIPQLDTALSGVLRLAQADSQTAGSCLWLKDWGAPLSLGMSAERVAELCRAEGTLPNLRHPQHTGEGSPTLTCVPVTDELEQIGSLALASYHRAEEQLALAKQTARRCMAIVRLAEHLRGVALPGLCVAIHHTIAELMPCDALVITRYHHSTREMEDLYLYHEGLWPNGPRYSASIGLAGYVIARGISLRVDDFDDGLSQVTRAADFGDPKYEITSLIATVFPSAPHPIGMLSTQAYPLAAYNTIDLSMLEIIAHLCAPFLGDLI